LTAPFDSFFVEVVYRIMPAAQILDGRKVASELCSQIRKRIEDHRLRFPQKSAPCLAIVQVGDNAASNTYIRHKIKVGSEVGIQTRHEKLSASSSEAEILSCVQKLNQDSSVHGIIVQLPLDQTQKSSERWLNSLLESISPLKDADGLCTSNLGKLLAGVSSATKWTSPLPATALGVMRLLQSYKVDLKGKRCLVIGKSRLVGNPTAQLLLQAGATVTVVHSQSGDWSDLSQKSEIIVVAAGVKGLLKAQHLKPGALIVDVGIHRTEKGLCGDVSPECYALASHYSPVPGGVGPLTVACLMENLCQLWLSAPYSN
jgi:methylenetetrahydrofolate dehydrogenase (NADP+)/methenyltetrahydrofolate cyclohydrolase